MKILKNERKNQEKYRKEHVCWLDINYDNLYTDLLFFLFISIAERHIFPNVTMNSFYPLVSIRFCPMRFESVLVL